MAISRYSDATGAGTRSVARRERPKAEDMFTFQIQTLDGETVDLVSVFKNLDFDGSIMSGSGCPVSQKNMDAIRKRAESGKPFRVKVVNRPIAAKAFQEGDDIAD